LLVRAEGVGPVIFARLLKYFGSVETVLGASVAALAKVEGVGTIKAESICRTRNKFDTEKEIALAQKLGVCIITIEDERYPTVLKKIYDPPPILYVKGSLTKADSLAVAIVGARRCSHYGLEQAGRFAHLLASAGFTIVSIAGLSLASIVVEAMPRSGALITARSALENSREVLAMPGRIDSPLSKGPHSLIKQGAKLVESVEDVIETLEYLQKDFTRLVTLSAAQAEQKADMPLFDKSQLNLTDAEKRIFDCLDTEPVHTEQIISFTGLAAGKVNAGLVSLRLKGVIKQLPGNHFVAKK